MRETSGYRPRGSSSRSQSAKYLLALLLSPMRWAASLRGVWHGTPVEESCFLAPRSSGRETSLHPSVQRNAGGSFPSRQ
jgi:hypothetical protein